MAEDRLRQAARVAPLVGGDRIRLARELQAWTQKDLVAATANALSSPALSQLEHGRTRPSPRTLLAISDATGCPAEFFIARRGEGPPAGFFRSLRSARVRERRQQLARARLVHDFVEALEDFVALPELDLPREVVGGDVDRTAIEQAADDARAYWELGHGPLPDVVRELERHGIVVVRSAVRREIDAFSVCFPTRPIVVLGSEKAVTARSRFDAAHELGHLVLHNHEHATHAEVEREAHEFAAAFLMPASAIRDQLPSRPEWPVLMQLKIEWRVSMQALLRRALTLEVMTPQRYVSAMKTVSARGWRRIEPGDDKLGPLETPKMIRRAIKRLREVDMTWQAVATEASLPVDQIGDLIERIRDPRPRVDL